jgi:hypothetical protein
MPTSYPDSTSESFVAAPGGAWKNWSGNILHTLSDRENAFSPTDRVGLEAIVRRAAQAGVTARVSGQRHSQPPLVVDDTRGSAPARKTWLVDLACYADLGPQQNRRIMLDPSGRTVTVNAGVREDELDTFLTRHDKLLRTVTAGGFFSIGGMTAVDVHGGTVDAPIFARISRLLATHPDWRSSSTRTQTECSRFTGISTWRPKRRCRIAHRMFRMRVRWPAETSSAHRFPFSF